MAQETWHSVPRGRPTRGGSRRGWGRKEARAGKREEGRDPTAAEVSVLGGLGEWGGSEEEGEGGWHQHDAKGGDKKGTSNTYPDAMSRAVWLSCCFLGLKRHAVPVLWLVRQKVWAVCRVSVGCSRKVIVDDGGSKIEGKDDCWVVVVRGQRCGVAVPSLTAPSTGTRASCARARW